MSTTVALFSSSRRHGNTGAVLDRMAAEVPIEVIDLSEISISPYDYSHRNRGDGFEPLIVRVLKYDQIIFVAPVHWYAVPPAAARSTFAFGQ
jgi:multimeric flavodoxin WrbA